MRTILLYLLAAVCLLQPVCVHAEESKSENARRAREMFESCFKRIYGEQGSSFGYDVNIFGLYKTKGHITNKGKKTKYVGDKNTTWKNEKVVYSVYPKKKTVEVWPAENEERDKYSSKFKFSVDEFNYSYTVSGSNYVITCKPKQSKSFGISEARVTLRKSDQVPVHVMAKVAFIKCNVDITDFQSGNIDDAVFVFPREKYKDYTFVDKR